MKIITVHKSGSILKEHDDIGVIRGWHLERGFKNVGYHFFIKRNGDLQFGRKIWVQGAHVKNHNADNIGICLSGDGGFKETQLITLEMVIRTLLFIGIINSFNSVFPHSHFDGGECPGFDLEDFKKKYLYS